MNSSYFTHALTKDKSETNNMMIDKMQQEKSADLGGNTSKEISNNASLDRVKELEEYNARQAARIAMDEKKLMDSDMERKNLHLEMQKHHAEMKKKNMILQKLLQQVLDKKNEEMLEEEEFMKEIEEHKNADEEEMTGGNIAEDPYKEQVD